MYVEGVESYFDFQSLQNASTYIAFYGWKGLSLSFPKLFWDLKLLEY